MKRVATIAGVLLVFLPSIVLAQGQLTGVVKDTSGAILPGVTVEAASPVLIEKIRSVVKVLDARSAIDTGLYRFTFHNADGTTDSVDARYTFVYEKRDGKWWIINHHSSLVPAAS